MAKWDELSSERKDKFWAGVEKWGLSRSDVTADLATSDYAANASANGCTVTINEDSAESSIPTKPFVVKSVAHAKELIGIPDEHFKTGKMSDRFIQYPPALAKDRIKAATNAPDFCAFDQELSTEEFHQLKLAQRAAILGDSSKVPPEMIELNNMRYYPGTAFVAAAQNITVTPGETLCFGKVGGEKVVVQIGTFTIEDGGVVKFLADTALEVQVSETQ